LKTVEVLIPKKLIVKDKPMIPGQEAELRLLELIKYNHYGVESTITSITNYIVNGVYQTEDKLYPFKDIESFFNFKEYINILSDKIDTVNMFILNKVNNPYVVDYSFSRWENDNAVYNVILCGVEDETD
jgi:hypothetical protein